MTIASANKKKTKKKSPTTNSPSLFVEVFKDIFVKHWWLSVLAVLLVVSAMLQAKTSHEVRRAIAKTQELREESQQQQIKWQALKLEMTSLTEADRISRLAKKQLEMIKVTTENEKIISL